MKRGGRIIIFPSRFGFCEDSILGFSMTKEFCHSEWRFCVSEKRSRGILPLDMSAVTARFLDFKHKRDYVALRLCFRSE